MFERSEMILKGLCLVLAVLLLWQVVSVLTAKDPFGDVTVPIIPQVKAASSGGVSNAPASTASNVPPVAASVPATVASAASPGANPVRTNALSATTRTATAPKPMDLPPVAQARVDKIKDSEVFGAIPKPLPMALLGIAGPDAFIRTATGQTGLLREGEELGGVKLLRVGTNRVLIEHEGQRKELTVFSGLGSETLLP